MTLDEGECWSRLGAARHGVLATLHEGRGTDAVPVVFAVDRPRIVIPVDRVKPKRSFRLQRLENLEKDPRCCLLIENYSDDWEALWWVRVHANGRQIALSDELAGLLSAKYDGYADPDTLAGAVVLLAESVTGWEAR